MIFPGESYDSIEAFGDYPGVHYGFLLGAQISVEADQKMLGKYY